MSTVVYQSCRNKFVIEFECPVKRDIANVPAWSSIGLRWIIAAGSGIQIKMNLLVD
jgi:hypothetical protein